MKNIKNQYSPAQGNGSSGENKISRNRIPAKVEKAFEERAAIEGDGIAAKRPQ